MADRGCLTVFSKDKVEVKAKQENYAYGKRKKRNQMPLVRKQDTDIGDEGEV